MTRLRLDPGNSPFDLESDDQQTVCDWLMASAMRRLVVALQKANIGAYIDDCRLRRALMPVQAWVTVYLNTHAYATADLKARGPERIHNHPLIVNLRADLAVTESGIYFALIAEAYDGTRDLPLGDDRATVAYYAKTNWWRALEANQPFG